MKKLQHSSFLLLFGIFTIFPLESFNTIESAEYYAKTHEEYPPIITRNAGLNPDYTSWYQAHAPSLLSKAKSFFRKSMWSVDQFKELLMKQLKSRQTKGYAHPHTILMRPRQGTECIILGPLFGTFHSLVRVLKELVSRGILGHDFKILKPDTYIIFDGNVIDGTPYNLETLSLVLGLMQANPAEVIYVAGQHEYENYWQSYGLKTELLERISDQSFVHYIAQFFAILPRSILLIDKCGKDIVRIGNLPSNTQQFNESSCSSLIKKLQTGQMKVCMLKKSQPNLDVMASIKGEKRLISYAQDPGLVLLPSETAVVTWSVFSAPNRIYQEYFKFFFDAYVVLRIGASFAQSTLELYHQDVRYLTGFTKAGTYEVTTGRPVSSKQQMIQEKAPLIIGCTLSLSKGVAAQGRQVRDGITLCINEQNQKGGIRGHRIEVIFMDDEYSPEKARQNVEGFMKRYKKSLSEGTLFLGNLGSPTLQAYLDLVKKSEVFVFFPITGAPLFRKPDLRGIVHWRTSYENEAKGLVSYTLKNYPQTTFAFLYQNDSYGLGALEGARKVLEAAGIKGSLEVPYERNSTSFKNAVDKIKASSAQAIGFFSTSFAATEFIRQAGVEYFIGKKLFALSDLAEDSFKRFAHEKGLDMVIAQFSPDPKTSSLQIIQEYRAALHAQGRTEVDVFMLEGFIAANLMIYILNKSDKDFSHASINKVIASIIDLDFKGLHLSFNEQTRELANLLWLDVGLPEWIVWPPKPKND